MFKLHVNFKYILIFLFFVHGVLYYIFPEDIHNTGSLLKYIKYIIIFIFSIFSISDIKRSNFALFVFLALLLFLLMKINHHSTVEYGELFSRYMSYIAPLSIIFLKDSITKLKIESKGIRLILIITLFFGFIEFFFLEGIFSYLNFSESEGYVRVATIFLNPNNAGLMIFILLSSIVPKGVLKWRDIFIFITLSICSIYVIFYTGSRTAILLIVLYIAFLILYKLRTRIIINSKNFTKIFRLIIFSVPFIFIYLLSKDGIFTSSIGSTRDLGTNSWQDRFNQIDLYCVKISNDFLAPDYYDFSTTYDNAYIQFWSDFGIWGILLLVITIFLLFIKNLKETKTKSLVLALLIAGFSVNIFYLWPTTYILWYLLLHHEKKRILSPNKNILQKYR